MIFPTVHLNGTNQEVLLTQLCDAVDALRSARAALESAAPNARDYYPQGSTAYSQAAAEFNVRLNQIDIVRGELEVLAAHVANANS